MKNRYITKRERAMMECKHGRSLGIYCRECGPAKTNDGDKSVMMCALEAGISISTAYGQVTNKLMPISDMKTLEHFAKLLINRDKAL